MKNRYTIAISLFLAFFTYSIDAGAQKFYAKVSSGYNLPLGGQNLYYFDFANATSRNNALTYDVVFVSLGQGMNLALAGGYHFNDHLACELDISWLRGDKQKAEHKYQQGITTCFLTPDMVQVIPSLVISTQVKTISPYLKFGALVGTGRVDYERIIDDNEHSEQRILRLKGGIAVGVSAAAGVRVKLGERLSLCGEVSMKNLNYAPTRGELTKAFYDGVDVLPTLTVYEKEKEYVAHYTLDENTPIDYSQADKDLRQRIPMGSFGINLGLVYVF